MAAELHDRQFHRAPRARRGLLEEQGRTSPGQQARGIGMASQRKNLGQLGGADVVDVEEVPDHGITLAPIAAASSLSSSDTTNEGAKRTAAGDARLVTR